MREELKLTLRFLEKLTLEPDRVGPDDVRPLLEAGISEEAISDAIHICALFNLIDRVADALGVEALPESKAIKGARFIVESGY
ncbi:MAG TPA: hypothetical protein VMS99_08300 [Acidimicrobiia bacterium]|nr:hypothetical protein [Acidimicrobiia bacterium]